MKELLEAFKRRVARELPELDAAAVEEGAAAYAAAAHHYVEKLVPKELRQSVLKRQRLANEWPWNVGAQFGRALTTPQPGQLPQPPEKPRWPLNVAMGDVVKALEATRDELAKYLAGYIARHGVVALMPSFETTVIAFGATAERQDQFTVRSAVAWGIDEWLELARREAAQQGGASGESKPEEPQPGFPGGDDTLIRAFTIWPLNAVSLVVSVQLDVEHDRRTGAARVSATSHGRFAIQALGAGLPTLDGTRAQFWNKDLSGLNPRTGSFGLTHRGHREPLQLSLLPDEGETLSAVLMRQVCATFKADGVRDWLVLHAMAQQQGGRSRFSWRWEEHCDMGGYDKRMRSGSRTEADAASEVWQRLMRFKNTELRYFVDQGDRWASFRIGPHGLIDIPAEGGTRLGGSPLTTVAKIHLNPTLYAPCRVGQPRPYFALVHEAVLRMPRVPQMLGALLALNARVEADKGGVVRVKAKTLWDYANVEDGHWQAKRLWPRATETTERALNQLATETGLSWEAEDRDSLPERIYTVRQGPWWTDRVIDGVKAMPALPSTANAPRTGAELAEWRKARGWSVRRMAELLEVSHPTVLRAEAKATEALPAEWTNALALARSRR